MQDYQPGQQSREEKRRYEQIGQERVSITKQGKMIAVRCDFSHGAIVEVKTEARKGEAR